jgi:hypothetical protein
LKIPHSTIRNILDESKRSLEAVYTKYLLEYHGVGFERYCSGVVDELLVSLEHLVEVTFDTIDPVLDKRMKTKKRWLHKELNSEGPFFNEVHVIARGLYEQFQDEREKFRVVYGCDTFDELKERRLKELEEWANASEIPVCHFPYLKGKHAFQIDKAMKNDIQYIALRIIREECPYGIQSAIVALPNSMSNIPIDFTNRIRIRDDEVVTRGHEQFYLNKYYIDDDTYLESFLNVEFLKTDIMTAVLKTLNATDIRIFLHVMSLRDENFYTTRQIVVDIGDVVHSVFSSDGQKNYMAVKESLYRMQFLNSGAIDSSLRGFTVKIFDYVDIYKSNDGKEMATIIVSINIVNEFIKDRTIKIYKDIIDKFKMDSSKVAIFPLQRERIRCSASAKDDNEPLLFHANIKFFRSILYFSNRRRKENIKIVERTLEEIIANKITVKSYERKGDTFLLEFYPISEQERRDLLNHNHSKKLLDLPYEQMELGIN